MRVRTTTLLATALLVLGTIVVPSASAATDPVKFGFSWRGYDAMASAGAKPDQLQVWAGEWNDQYGWGDVDKALAKAKANGATAVIEWYYWGDAMSTSCVSYGCDGKSRAEWYEMTDRLAGRIRASGASAIVVVESEFNKGGVTGSYAPTLDGYLRSVEDKLRWGAPGTKIAIGFGNWGHSDWDRFPKAVSGADYVGFQVMAASTRQSYDEYVDVDDDIREALAAAKPLGKPVLLHDLALSSYPAWSYEAHQSEGLARMFADLGELRADGLVGVVWRQYQDDPDMDGWFGVAEKHWGLFRADMSAKPAWRTWTQGVKAHRGATDVTSTTTTATTGTFDVTFRPVKVSNWWIQVDVEPDTGVAGVDVQVAGGPWTAMKRASWGDWTASVAVPTGASVAFRARSTSGAYDYSSGSAPTSTTTPTTTATFDASFTNAKVSNWWQQVHVASDRSIAKVDVRIGDGSWHPLTLRSWGDWAGSYALAYGEPVVFRATATDGSTDTSTTYWR